MPAHLENTVTLMKVFTTEEETLSLEQVVVRIQENPFAQLLIWTVRQDAWTPWYEIGWLAVEVGSARNVHIHRTDEESNGESDLIEPREFGSLLGSAAATDIQVWDPGTESWTTLEAIEWISVLFLGSELYYSADGEELELRRWEVLRRLQQDADSITYVATSVQGSEDLEWSPISENPSHWPYPLEQDPESQPDGPEVGGDLPPLDDRETRELKPGVAVIETPGPDGTPNETWLIRGPVFSAGRDDTKSTVLLAIEPFDDPVTHLMNRKQSMRISSKHLAVRIDGSGLSVTDLNSSNGTSVNDVPLVPLAAAALSTGDVVQIGQVLSLQCDVRTNQEGVTQSAVLARLGNRAERRYVVGTGGVGGVSGDLSSLEPLVSDQQGVSWRLAWTSNGLQFDIAPSCGERVSLTTARSIDRDASVGPRWLSSGDAIMVDGEVAAAVRHVSS